MEGNFSASPPVGSGDGAAESLGNLPSCGLLSSTVLSSNLGGMRVYICNRDTSPPDDQCIKTDQANILIRSFLLKNQNRESCSKDGKATVANQGSRKRAAEKALDDKAAGKKAMPSSSQEGVLDKDLRSLTVEKLRALLKVKGLSVKGRKDELIARLRGVNG